MTKDTYKEIEEKKTSKLGYLILFVLFVFLIIIGQTIFSDIRRIPEHPEQYNSCTNVPDDISTYTYSRTCSNFKNIDEKFNIDSLYQNIAEELAQIANLNSNISSNKRDITSNESQIDVQLKNYDISLQEVIADEEALLDKPAIKADITQLNKKNDSLAEENESLIEERDAIIEDIQPELDKLKAAQTEASDYYQTKNAYYNFKIFLLQLLFVLPFFGIFLYLYLKFKKKDSPYTIIISAVFFAAVILFLQIVLVFLYDILPKEWLARIFEFLMSVSILKYIIYYGAVALVIAILGGIVYFLQKKFYNPKKIALRHLKDNKCPKCSTNLDLTQVYCPQCGKEVRTKCSKCNNWRYKDLPFCPNCGHKE